jgi:outer membrane protein W
MKLKSFLITAVLMVATISLSAQTNLRSGKFGVGIDDISTSPNFLFKYYLTDNFSMNFITGIDLEFPGADAPEGLTKLDGYNLRLGLAGMYHFNTDKVSPYLGLEAIYGIKQNAGYYAVEPDPKNNVMLGLILGADYFLFEKFSLGIKQNLNFDFQLSRDIPVEETDMFINTTTQFTARYYFN